MVHSARSRERYDSVQIALHWLTSLLIIAAVCLIWTVQLTPKGDLHNTLFFLHRSCGVTVFGLVLLRLVWRALHDTPPPPAGIPAWQQRAGTVTHWLLYGLFILMPVTGFIDGAANNHPVSFFFLFDLPLLPENKALAHLAGAIHETLQWAVYGLVLLHAAAALHHHFVLRDNVLRRMLPGG
jgi:cytochrome b561